MLVLFFILLLHTYCSSYILLHTASSYCLHCLHFQPAGLLFSISGYANVVVTSFLSFCLSGKVLIYPSFLDSFSGYRILS